MEDGSALGSNGCVVFLVPRYIELEIWLKPDYGRQLTRAKLIGYAGTFPGSGLIPGKRSLAPSTKRSGRAVHWLREVSGTFMPSRLRMYVLRLRPSSRLLIS